MHDKIKSLLPKEQDERTEEGIYMRCENRGANKMLAEVHAKIPEIVALVEGEVREKIKEEIDDALTAWDCPGIYGGHTQECHTKESAKKFIFEALFSNKK